MRRFVLGLLGLATLAATIVPLLAAAFVKNRAERPGVAEFEPLADEIDLAALFETFELKSRAPSFRGGDVLLWYGGGVLDLRGATLDPAGGRLVARSIFGGMQLIVPEEWPVHVRSKGIFGGVGSQIAPAPETGPALVIEAMSVFGGIGITTRGARDETQDGAAHSASNATPDPSPGRPGEGFAQDPQAAGA